MGAVTSRPVIHTVESGLLAIARLIDVVVRTIDRLLSAIVARIFSPALYAHFYVSPPGAAEAAVDVGPDGLTRVCTNDGVCYVPATRLHQHRKWRNKQKQDDRLKHRKMRAEWAAAGLDVREMQRLESEKRKSKASLTSNMISRQTTRESQLDEKLPGQQSKDATTKVKENDEKSKKEKPLYVMGNIAPRATNKTIPKKAIVQSDVMATEEQAKDVPPPAEQAACTQRKPKQSVRTLTAVREASHDHGATVPIDLLNAFTNPVADGSSNPSNGKVHKRRESAPSALMAKMRIKSAPVADATSASQIVPDARYATVQHPSPKTDEPNSSYKGGYKALMNVQHRVVGHRSTASLPSNSAATQLPAAPLSQQPFALPPMSSPVSTDSAVAAGTTALPAPALVQPKPRRPIRTSFDTIGGAVSAALNSPTNPGFMMSADWTPVGARSATATPPAAGLRATPRTRTSFDISPATTPFSNTFSAGMAGGSSTTADDASSIRSKRSTHTASFAPGRSSTPNTPPPYVVQLCDRASKSRWESSAKERKVWKGEVKRIALNRVQEQHSAYRASMQQQQLQQQLQSSPIEATSAPLYRPQSTPITRS